jgi:hypothetical protein
MNELSFNCFNEFGQVCSLGFLFLVGKLTLDYLGHFFLPFAFHSLLSSSLGIKVCQVYFTFVLSSFSGS